MNCFTLYICENYYTEYAYVISKYGLDNIHLRPYSCPCVKGDKLNTLAPEKPGERVFVVGSNNCYKAAEIEDKSIEWFKTKYCLEAILPEGIINYFMANNKYVVSGSWLKHWEDNIDPFDTSRICDMKESFSELYNEVILTHFLERSLYMEDLTAFSNYVKCDYTSIELDDSIIYGRLEKIIRHYRAIDIKEQEQLLKEEIESLQNNLEEINESDQVTKEQFYFNDQLIISIFQTILSLLLASNSVEYIKEKGDSIKGNTSYFDSSINQLIIPCSLNDVDYGYWCVKGFKSMTEIEGYLEMANMTALLFTLSISRYELIETIKLAQAKQLRHDKLASIGQMAAGLAHEINNPLSFVSSNVTTFRRYCSTVKKVLKPVINNQELLNTLTENKEIDKRSVDEIKFIMSDVSEMFGEIDEGIGRIAMIVKRFRRFTNIDQFEILMDVDVNRLVEDVAYIFRSNFMEVADITMSLGELPMINGNKSELSLILYDVMMNSIDAIKLLQDQSFGKIAITTENISDHVVINIVDNGVGIAPLDRHKIFDPFFTTKAITDGVGLGLSFAYDVIKKHKGSITLSTNESNLTTCVINLPIVEED